MTEEQQPRWRVYRIDPRDGGRLYLDTWWGEPTAEDLKYVYGLGMYEYWPVGVRGKDPEDLVKVVDVSLFQKKKKPPVRKLELDDD